MEILSDELKSMLTKWTALTGIGILVADTKGDVIYQTQQENDFCKGMAKVKTFCKECMEHTQEFKGRRVCPLKVTKMYVPLKMNDEPIGRLESTGVLTEQTGTDVEERLNETQKERYAEVKEIELEKLTSWVELLGIFIQKSVVSDYEHKQLTESTKGMEQGIAKMSEIIRAIHTKTSDLKDIQNTQKILALNASIEAARAGEAGRGFEVVALEVEKLSNKSSKLNKEIEDLVKGISKLVMYK